MTRHDAAVEYAFCLAPAARTLPRYTLLLHMGIGAALLGWWLFVSVFR